MAYVSEMAVFPSSIKVWGGFSSKSVTVSRSKFELWKIYSNFGRSHNNLKGNINDK